MWKSFDFHILYISRKIFTKFVNSKKIIYLCTQI